MENLTNGTTYYFQVRAVNGEGNGAVSDAANATPAGVPTKPSSFTATAGDEEVTLSASTDDNGSSITKWQYRQATSSNGLSSASWQDITSTSASLSHDVENLTNGTEYFFQVRAVNGEGNGAVSDAANATPAGVPTKPSSFTATAGDEKVTLSASTDDNGSSITKWQYRQATSSNGLSSASWQDITSTSETLSHDVENLTNGTTYYFQVRAVNGEGNGAVSDAANATPAGVPTKPSPFTATAGDEEVTLSARTDDNGSSITKWQYRQATSSNGLSSASWQDITSTSASLSHDVENLTNGTTYYFQVRAVNDEGNGAVSDAANATPAGVPTKPSPFTATAGDEQVTLSARTGANGSSITKWQYRQATSSNGLSSASWQDITSTSTSLSHDVENLTNGTTYYFQVRAVNDEGNGAVSDAANATPAGVPTKPSPFTAMAGDEQVTLSARTGANGSSITKWQYRQATSSNGLPSASWQDITSTSETLSHDVENLTNGTTYYFQVRAVNGVGDGEPSDVANATPAGVPTKPSSFTATAGDEEVTLSARTGANGSSITKWQYRQATSSNGLPSASWRDITSTNTSLSHDVENLTNGTTYYFQVRAVNGVGNSDPSDVANATPAGVPTKPSSFTATAGDEEVTLSASTDDNGSSITKWQYKQATSSDDLSSARWQDITSTSETLSHDVDRLSNGTRYYFQVRAVNGEGNSDPSDVANATPVLPIPNAPTGLSATAGDTEVDLSWTLPTNASSIEKVQVRYAAGSSVPSNTPWTDIPNSASATRHTVTGLTNGTEYAFQVRAANGSGEGAASNTATATPAGVPTKPSSFTATAGDEEVTLSASTDDNGSSITKWQYRQATSSRDLSSASWQDITSTSETLSHDVENLTNGTEYFFQVRAVNGEGNGAVSDAANATPAGVPTKPSSFTATAGDEEVTLSASTDDNGSSITKWQYRQATSSNGLSSASWQDITSTSASLSHDVENLTNGTTYYFQVRAVNGEGNGAVSDAANATPAGVPTKPSSFTATAGDEEVTLSARTDDNGSSITKWQYRQATSSRDLSSASWQDITSTSETLSHDVENLTNGTEYFFQVRAVNGEGNGAVSDAANATPAGVPTKPSPFTATAGDEEVTLSASTDDNGSSITKWQYRQATSSNGLSSASWQDITSTSETLSHDVENLTNGTTYYFQVRAVNGEGNGAVSDAANATPAGVPTKPSPFTATAGDEEVTLSARTDDNGSSITKWQYRQATSSNGLSSASWQDITSTSETLSHDVERLSNGTTYYFQVRAVNGEGNGAVSDAANATPAGVPTKPRLGVTAGDEQVTLSASTGANGSSITKWQYKQATSSDDLPSASWQDITSTSETLSHDVENLTNGTRYYFQVRAVNDEGNSEPSDVANAMPVLAIPNAPTGLGATAGDTEVDLSWTLPTNASSIEKVQVRYAAGSSVPPNTAWTDIPNSASATRHTVTGLTNGTEYAFQVRAANGSGEGAASNTANATPAGVPTKPSPFTATAGDEEVTLSASTDDNGSSITKWQYRQATSSNGLPSASWQDITSTSETLSHDVENLTNGTTYYFQVRAVNGEGNGAVSDAANATPAGVPTKPSPFTATAGDEQVTLSARTGANGSSITKWQYRQATSSRDLPSASWRDITSTSETLNHDVENLTNGTTYYFQVRAVNGEGNGAVSDAANATPAGVPTKPSPFTATAGDEQVTLSARTGANGSSITKWQYRQATSSNGLSSASWQDITSTSTSLSHDVENLTNGTTYYFQVRAVNDEGNGAVSDAANATPAGVPTKPSPFTAMAGDEQVTLSARTGANGSSITKWQYRQATSSNGLPSASWQDITSTSETLSHDVENLTNGTTYYFQVRAVNGVGDGEPSDVANATPAGVPTKPSSFTATAGDEEVTLSARTGANGSSITKWQYRQATSSNGLPSASWRDITSTNTSLSHDVENLTNGTTYYFQVRAVNGVGNSDPSDVANATPAGVPTKPSSFTATAGDEEVTLSASTDDNGSSITKWQYKQATSSDDLSSARWQDITSTSETLSHDVDRLSNGTRYYFQVRAVNGEGNSDPSDVANATPVLPIPNAPTGLSATAGDTEVDLSWTLPTNASSIEKVQVRYAAGSSVPSNTPWTDIPNSASATRHTVTGLTNGTEYAFQVRAANGSGEGAASNTATATPAGVPTKPSSFTATAGDEEVTLSASTDDNGSSITKWQYRQATSSRDLSSASWQDITSTSETLSHDVENLTNGTEYFFQVRAVNGEGNGAVSDAANATPAGVPTKPSSFTATAGDEKVTLSASTGANGSSITKWQYRQATSSNGLSSASWQDITSTSESLRGYDVTNLTNGTTYYFQVRAVNGEGNSDPSDVANAKPAGVPTKPSSFTATAGDGEVTLSANTDDNGSSITKWQYRQATSSNGLPSASWQDITSTSETLSHDVENLTNGTEYFFQVRAVNDEGNGAVSDAANATPAGVPTKPSSFTATAGDEEVTLSARTGANGSSITKWQYRRATNPNSLSSASWRDITSTSESLRDHAVTNLNNGTTYYFQVRAVNDEGNGAVSDAANATPAGVPTKPSPFTATLGDGEVKLSARTDDNGSSITKWQYRQATRSDRLSSASWQNIASTAESLEHVVDGLNNGTEYFFQVRAVNGVGDGEPSDAANATPAGVPTKPRLSVTAGDEQVTLSASTGANGSSILRWQYRQATSSDGLSSASWRNIDSTSDRPSRVVEGLNNGTTYYFQVRAVNGEGSSEPSDAANATPGGVPIKPSNFKVVSGDQEVTLEARTDDNGSAITKWQYRQATSSDGLSSARWQDITSTSETLGHDVDRLSNGTEYFFQVRAFNGNGYSRDSEVASATPATPTVILVLTPAAISENGGVATVTARLDRTPSAATTVTIAISATAVLPAVEDDFTVSDNKTLTIPAGSTTSTGDAVTIAAVNNEVEAADKSVTVSGSTTTRGVTGPADVTLTITDDDGLRIEERREAATVVLAEVGRATLVGATNVIGHRLDASAGTASGGATLTLAGRHIGGAPRVQVAAGDGWDRIDRWDDRPTGESQAVDATTLLSGSAFTLALGAASDESDGSSGGVASKGDGSAWTVWGRGDWRQFESRPAEGEHEGSALSGWLGVDAQLDDRLLAGVAVSRGVGKAEYRLDDRGDGKLEVPLTAAWPYLQIRQRGGGEVRLLAGFGRGEVRHRPNVGAAEQADLSMMAVSIGVRQPLAKVERYSLYTTGDAGLVQMETDGSSGIGIGGLRANAGHLRGGVEAVHDAFRLPRTYLTLQPHGALIMRQDTGDGVTGTGLELWGGVRVSVPGSGFTVEANGHWLSLHGQSGTRRWGASVAAQLEPGAGGRGLSLSLGAEQGWQNTDVLDQEDAFVGRAVGEDTEPSDHIPLSLHAGYGFGYMGGVLTPFTDMTFGSGDADTRYYQTGIGFVRDGIQTTLTTEHREGGESDSDKRVGLRVRLNY